MQALEKYILTKTSTNQILHIEFVASGVVYWHIYYPFVRYIVLFYKQEIAILVHSDS